MSKFQDAFWPSIVAIETARKANKLGFIAAIFVASVSSIMGILSKKPIYESSVIDGIIFAVLAYGINKNSRVAAIAALLIYSLETIYKVYAGGSIGIAPIFVLYFINSIRGTFAFNNYKKAPLPVST